MKRENGITLISLVLYVVILAIVLVIMSTIINNFYNNIHAVDGNVKEIVEFSKFNNYFLKEIKTHNNQVENVGNNYILFKTGNIFSLSNDTIYYNNVRICSGVQSMQVTLGKNGDGIDKSIININLNLGNFNKSISYKVENIY